MSLDRLYQQLKNVYHYVQAQWWRAVNGWPDRKLHIYGVTGTDGKTTTSLLLGSILRAAHSKEKVGLLSTEIFWIGADEDLNKTHMTSTDAKIVFKKLRRMVAAGVEQVVMEMTSHALDQHRLAGVVLDGAIFLNLGHEHLDYHKTMEEYAKAKARIVNYVRSGGALVYKGDDEWVVKGLRKMTNDQFPMTNQAPSPKFQIDFIGFTSEEAKSVESPLPGDFNKENVLAASLLARAVGISDEDIRRGVDSVQGVPGRVEWINLTQSEKRKTQNLPRIVIDFAQTPEAYENLFSYLRGETTGKLVAVFGAPGRRDKTKRPLLTKTVSQYADEIILTQDEPYDDPEEEIYTQLKEGLQDSIVPYRVIEDRREAIKYALESAGPDDVVAITGMGNYMTRKVGHEEIPWNDKEVTLELLMELKKSKAPAVAKAMAGRQNPNDKSSSKSK